MIKIWYDMATLSTRYIETSAMYDGEMAVHMNDGTIKRFPRGAALPIEQCSREIQEPQEMLDALVALGYKPNKLVGTPGHVDALEKHIAFAESVVARVLK